MSIPFSAGFLLDVLLKLGRKIHQINPVLLGLSPGLVLKERSADQCAKTRGIYLTNAISDQQSDTGEGTAAAAGAGAAGHVTCLVRAHSEHSLQRNWIYFY